MRRTATTIAIVLMILIPVAFADSLREDPFSQDIIMPEELSSLGSFAQVKPISTTHTRQVNLPLLQQFTSNIPERLNTDRMDITINTDPANIVELLVNDAQFRRVTPDENGTALFVGILLRQGDNEIKVVSRAPSGENITEIYNVVVDMQLPELTLSELPDIMGETQTTLTGNVNKKVDVEVFLRQGQADAVAPKAPEGLVVNATDNAVQLSWQPNDEGDFLQYIIYRNDIGPIATTTPASYVSYQDIQIQNNSRYEYSISAMDTNCLESTRSKTVSVVSSDQLRTSVPAHAIDPGCDLSRSMSRIDSFTAEGAFNFTVQLSEGYNTIIVRATDLNNKTVTAERTVFVDSEPPTIDITSPRPGIMIYEQFANSVHVEGETEPFAKVEISKRGEVIAETIGEAEDPGLPETQLQLGTIEADTTADAQGRFEFENVNFISYVHGSLMPEEVPPGEVDLPIRTGLQDTDTVAIYFRATDRAGKDVVKEIQYSLGTCWGGNFTWGIQPLIQYQSPSWLSAERLSEGTEEISFYFNFTYHGSGSPMQNVEESREGRNPSRTRRTSQGKGTRVTSLQVQDACDDYISTRPDYDWACRALSSCRATLNPTGDMAYITCHLNKVDEIEDFDGEELKQWFKALNNEMRFPLRLTLTYQEEIENTVRTGSQTSCEEVTYAVDNSLVNFSRVLPDWLLVDGVRIMDNIVEGIDKINKQLRQILKYLAIGCIASFVTKFGIQVYRRVSCSYDNLFSKVKQLASLTQEQQDQLSACNQCLKQFEDRDKKMFGNLSKQVTSIAGIVDFKVQDKVPDACLDVCFPSCGKAWDTEARNYQIYRWMCDRVFCHAAPSRWTENKSDATLNEKAKEVKSCKSDQSAKGEPLQGRRCADLAQYKSDATLREVIQADDICFEIYDKTGTSKSIYVLGEKIPGSEELYSITNKKGPAQYHTGYVLKVSERYYLTAQPQTCNQICGIADSNVNDTTETVYLDAPQLSGTATDNMTAACSTVATCQGLVDIQHEKQIGDKKMVVYSATPEGFAKGCFYNENSRLRNPSVVSEDPEQRWECCCINTQSVNASPNFYQPTDPYIENVDQNGSVAGVQQDYPTTMSEDDFTQMKWSYRYWKTAYAGKEFNPFRYIKGRDQSACFGQNNFIFDGFASAEGGNLLTVDPFKQHTSAFQCGCLTGIINRLTMIQNILMLMSGCLKEVRETGRGDAGVCKELFTQYVCNLIWDIISYIQDGCIPFLGGIDFDKQEAGVGQALKVGTKSVFDSMDDSMSELSSEYGNAQVNSLLGTGQGSIARAVCLAAFGFDWELSVDSIIDAAYSTPFATLVQPVTKSREYLGFDPRSGETKYEYASSWIINPGCNFDSYDVSLACVSESDMAAHPEINCGKIDCDCSYLQGPGPQMPFYRGRTLSQNTLEDKEHSEIIQSRYRYDHLKITLRPDRQAAQYAPSSLTNCYPAGHEDGVFYFPLRDRTPSDIVDCAVDFDSGQFYCSGGELMWDKEGKAYFHSATLNDKNIAQETLTIKSGEALFFSADIFNSGRPKCFYLELSPYGQEAVAKKWTVDFEGSQSISLPLGTAEIGQYYAGRERSVFSGCFPLQVADPARDRQVSCKSLFTQEEQTRPIGQFLETPTDHFRSYTFKFRDMNNDSNITLDANSSDELTVTVEEWRSTDTKTFNIGSGLNHTSDGYPIVNLSIPFKITQVPFKENLSTVTYKIISGMGGRSTSERWNLKYGLYYIAEDGYDCDSMIDGDIVFTNGVAQEQMKSFTVKEFAEEENATKCNMSGEAQTKLPCDCNGDGDVDDAEDCAGAAKFCVAPIGARGKKACFPECKRSGLEELTVPCECNRDNKIDGNSTEDCLEPPCKCSPEGQIVT